MKKSNIRTCDIFKCVSNLLLGIIAMNLFLSLSAGEVETATHCDVLILNNTSYTDNHTIPLFDPGLGDLVGVDLAVDLGVQQSFRFENEENDSQDVGAKSESVLQITMPNGDLISVNASNSAGEKLAAYDGETDYEGTSGKTIDSLGGKGTAKEQYSKPSDFVASYQNETISLPAKMTMKSSTSGSLSFRLSTVAESKFCVTYTYEPDGS